MSRGTKTAGARDLPLGGEEGVFRVDNGLSLGGLTDQSFAVLGERHNGRGRSTTFRVFNNSRGLSLHDGDTRVGGT